MNKEEHSGPLNIDHSMILTGSAKSITTNLTETGFDPTKYTEEALSDHRGLLSHIEVYPQIKDS